MKGRILDFSVAQDGGLILSEDGVRYMFAANQWRGQSLPKVGQDVDFDVDDAQRAIEIYPDVFAVPQASNTAQTLDDIGNKVGQSFNKFTADINNSLMKVKQNDTPSTFIDFAVLAVTKNYANFEGRARRKEYWGSMLVYFILSIIVSMVVNLTFLISEYLTYFLMVVASLIYLALIIPMLSITVRRLHDIDKSGWFYLVSLIPLIGGIWLLILLCTEGTRGENRFGADPKAAER